MKTSFPFIYVPYEMIDSGAQVAVWKRTENGFYIIHRWMDETKCFGEEDLIYPSEVIGLASLTDIRTLRAAEVWEKVKDHLLFKTDMELVGKGW